MFSTTSIIRLFPFRVIPAQLIPSTRCFKALSTTTRSISGMYVPTVIFSCFSTFIMSLRIFSSCEIISNLITIFFRYISIAAINSRPIISPGLCRSRFAAVTISPCASLSARYPMSAHSLFPSFSRTLDAGIFSSFSSLYSLCALSHSTS